ncbi:uncharacterized protein TNCV_4462421 [Trichonephila clavipes]|nr:uncharacterized protein TNCV_4462421 [Trichonephila clavipes]
MRTYDFRIQKIYRLHSGSKPQPWAYKTDKLPSNHLADLFYIVVFPLKGLVPVPPSGGVFDFSLDRWIALLSECQFHAKSSHDLPSSPRKALSLILKGRLNGKGEAAVAEWYRYRTVACFVTGSSPVPLKTRRVGQRCTLNLSRAETSSRWCGVVVRSGGASSGVVHVT